MGDGEWGMARKTIDVASVVASANAALAFEDASFDYRMGIIAMVESVLVASGMYKGFSYLPSELAHDGTLVLGHDDSRRVYSI